jgi:hypothetical protein
MTSLRGRLLGRPGAHSGWVALLLLTTALAAAPACAAKAGVRHAKSAEAHGKVAKRVSATRAHVRRKSATTHVSHDLRPDWAEADLSYSDEFERAELIERMLSECRGIAYNAYELAQTSGEALHLPAPIQLMTVRVRHPYCAQLMRTYARKTRV